jgi:riboflavin kinase/FMN adenylyltransferase
VTLRGKVTPYAGNGRKFGYPTANIASDTNLDDGVYFGFASLAQYKNHPALIFIGTPETVGDTERRVEAHVLDIEDVDYYGEILELQVAHFHRPNQKLNSIEALLQLMKDDEKVAREWFRNR